MSSSFSVRAASFVLALSTGVRAQEAAPPPAEPAAAPQTADARDVGARRATTLSASEREAAERALLQGLRWLVRHQNPDGSWSACTLKDRCDVAAPCFDPREDYRALYDEGATALAVLAFLEAGYTNESKQALVDPVRGTRVKLGEVVKNALMWLVKRQHADGQFTKDKACLYNEALCTFALAEALRLTGNRYWKEPAQKGVRFVEHAQRTSPDGKGLWGWRYQSLEDVQARLANTSPEARERELHDADTSITTWCVRALDAAHRAGLAVTPESLDGARAFLRWVSTDDGRAGYIDPRGAGATVTGKNDHFEYHPAVMSALAMIGRSAEPTASTDGWFELAAKQLLGDLPEIPRSIAPATPAESGAKGPSNDYYYWHQGTLALRGHAERTHDARAVTRWNQAVVEAVLALQAHDPSSCRDGGWVRGDRWGYAAGPIYSTAMNALTLDLVLGFSPPAPWWTDATPRARVGERARPFMFARKDGALGASRELEGSVVLLDFASPWMAGYADEAARVAELVAESKDAPFACVGVVFAPKGDAGAFAERASSTAGTWHLAVRDDLEDSIFEGFDVRAFPTRVVLDAQGVIRGRDLSFEDARALALRLVAEARAAKPK